MGIGRISRETFRDAVLRCREMERVLGLGLGLCRTRSRNVAIRLYVVPGVVVLLAPSEERHGGRKACGDNGEVHLQSVVANVNFAAKKAVASERSETHTAKR